MNPNTPRPRNDGAKPQVAETGEITIQRMKTHQLPRRGINIEEAERQNMLQTVLRDEERIAELADPAQDPTRIRFPERLFRENFLPVLTGEAYQRLPEGLTADQLADQATERWLSVSRGPLNEVDVVEENGKVAFTIPAFLNTRAMNSEQDRTARPLKMFTDDYRKHQNSVPVMANAMLKQGLDMKLTRLFATATAEEAQEKMKKVYEYYKTPDPRTKKPAAGTESDPGGFMGEMSFD